jgi:hypothetical protein
MAELRKLQDDLYQVKIALYGDDTRSRLGYETLPGITSRLAIAEWSSWWNTSEPTKTVRDQAAIASELFEPVLNTTRRVAEDLSAIEKRLVELKVPYTPGRGKDWGQE